MSADLFACPDCAASYDAEDNYCRRCGMFLAALRSMTPAEVHQPPRDLVAVRTGLPAPVRKAATALAIGTALQIGVGLAGKYLATQASRQAVSAIRPRPRRTRGREAAPRGTSPMDEAAAVSETVMVQRVWIRRNQA
jgi:hypothetical protein